MHRVSYVAGDAIVYTRRASPIVLLNLASRNNRVAQEPFLR